ncbi:deoxyribonuclease-2-alpha-like [Lethenteron reissneri]|uniref:deoxyribonuclease-2-alpha-like n=1 Tax=Lethenteron reissneri TaxID=7753 RepID=UPI002AB621E8|nr:deoxyribonuclease-2-alpha-like [Lethenteron reissneri]
MEGAMSLVVFLLFSMTGTTWCHVSCLNGEGKSVDWFIVYKLPKGKDYLYLDKSTQSWQKAQVDVDDNSSPVYQTVNQLYNGNTTEAGDVAFVLYNDEPPNSPRYDSICGHTKGVVMLDGAGGFWLVHSTPHFPPSVPGPFAWPHTALRYGQSFLCVSYGFDQFSDIALQLRYNEPDHYSCQVGAQLQDKLPDLQALCAKTKLQVESTTRVVELTSSAGKTFRSFAKTHHFDDDLYVDLVAPNLKSSLYLESWVHGVGVFDSNCSGEFCVCRVSSISLPSVAPFSSEEDHSKWCVSQTGGSTSGGAWTCVGDINRNRGEEYRGGGTVCTDDPTIWAAFAKATTRVNPCPAGPRDNNNNNRGSCDCAVPACRAGYVGLPGL